MSPCPTANSAPAMDDAQSPRLHQRRNAMANVMDGMSSEDIHLIRSQHCLNTAKPTCLSATASSPTSSERSTSSCGDGEKLNGSGLAALSLDSSPQQSPSLRRRRNGVPDIFADVDSVTLGRLRASRNQSTSRHESTDDHLFQF